MADSRYVFSRYDKLKRLFQVAGYAFLAIAAAIVAAAMIQLADRIGMGLNWALIFDNAWGEALFYTLPPTVVLSLLFLRKTSPASLVVLIIQVSWLALIFALWAEKPIRVYGAFPWWGFKRHFIEMLPIPLASAFIFVRLRTRLSTL